MLRAIVVYGAHRRAQEAGWLPMCVSYELLADIRYLWRL